MTEPEKDRLLALCIVILGIFALFLSLSSMFHARQMGYKP